MNNLFSFSDLLSVDRFCRERFVDLVPSVDVDATATDRDLGGMLAEFREVLGAFEQKK